MLQITDLSIYYGKSIALRSISLEVGDNEIVALLGANGAGKSTTLRTISGLLTPRSGEIIFMGERINGLPPHKVVKKGISHCPEGRRIFPDLTSIREPRHDGRVPALGPKGSDGKSRQHVRAFPEAQRETRSKRGDLERRGTADARNRKGPYEQAEASPSR